MLYNNIYILTKYCIPNCIIMDQDSAFMSSLMNYLFNKFNIKMKTVAPFNHQSLQVEHEIKSLSTILTKHLTNLGQMWTKYLSLATFAYNTFNSPNLTNISPYELVFRRKPKILLNLETTPDIKVSGTFKIYIIFPLTSQFHTALRKIMIKYVGPFVVYKIIDPHNYLLMTLDGKLLRGLFKHDCLKPAILRTSEGNVTNLVKLKQLFNTGLTFSS